MEIVRVPLLNANEDEIEIVSVLVEEGARVRAGDTICEIESTKATAEVEAPRAGYVRELRAKPGLRLKIGALLCALTETPDAPVDLGAAAGGAASEGEVQATRKARELAQAHGIDLASLGVQGIVKARDVERAIGGTTTDVAERSASVEPLVAASGERVVLYGASAHARALHDLIRSARPDVAVVAAVDDAAGKPDAPRDVLGVPVVGTSGELERLRADGITTAGLGVGAVLNNAVRIELFEQLERLGFMLPSFVHARAVVEPSARMGLGNQVFAGAIVGANVRLGDNTIINSGAVLSHDCVIGSHSHITPGAILAGGVNVGRNTVIGMGVTVYLGVSIGDNVQIANGCHIMSDVPDGAVVRSSR